MTAWRGWLGRLGAGRFVPLLPNMRVTDWVVIVAIWVTLAFASVNPAITTVEQTRGVVVTAHDMLIGQLMDAAIWLLLLWLLLRVFDGTPFRRGHRARSTMLRALALAAAATTHGVVSYALMHSVGRLLVVDPTILKVDALVGMRAALVDAFDALPLPIIAYLILRTVIRRRERDRAAAASEAALRDARLHGLANDMRPHFLFNTLNGIALLVRIDPRAAEEMIVQLSDLLRLTLEVGTRREQSLREEIMHLDHYLALQQMRFGDRLTVRNRVDDDVLDALVPPMILQPLVENALGHGLEPKPGPVSVELSARRVGSLLVLSVRDDGVGLPSSQAPRERTGLGNTRERLALLYPDEHGLTLESAGGAGTVATISLPFHTTGTAAGREEPVPGHPSALGARERTHEGRLTAPEPVS
ncbi:MAG TPA: sensor histidine kinase [Gemmatimonadaceae bacterium]|nr:sensor histidine kinase [Gemmatimonadaceae bacterium]